MDCYLHPMFEVIAVTRKQVLKGSKLKSKKEKTSQHEQNIKISSSEKLFADNALFFSIFT